ncbi:MAG TPA: helix-turn-helix transcriptional regulator [Candidatus Acidoferrum sp.]|nr:helix-turn-helix transcriptional regulator [Candidatus Acidoferrum sp.]
MVIGDRLRELREAKSLSQGDIEKRTGLLRCYISRVENGHTVPAVETLEKIGYMLRIPSKVKGILLEAYGSGPWEVHVILLIKVAL